MAAVAVANPQDVLSSYQSYGFHSLALRNELFSRWSANGGSHGGNLDRTENITAATNLSDSAYDVDPNDMERLEPELLDFKSYLSAVKFKWVEKNVKRRYISRILSNDVALLVSQKDNDDLDAIRADKKASLQGLKAQNAALDAEIQSLASSLDETFPLVSSLSDQTGPLLSSITDLELELAKLRAARESTAADDMNLTVREAEAVLEEQEMEMARVMEEVEKGKREVGEVKARLNRERKEVEKMGVERQAVEKAEAEARRSVGGGTADGREIEAGCRWYATATELYNKLFGIISVKTVGQDPNRPSELQITYDLGHPRTATLALEFDSVEGRGKRLRGAHLVDSLEDISDIVECHLATGDVTLLVQEVLSRIAR